VFSHRYLEDGSTQFICMNCFQAICTVRSAADATPFIEAHRCEKKETPKLKANTWRFIPGV
jgi:hypothetical protein